jgi:hypothetical protein
MEQSKEQYNVLEPDLGKDWYPGTHPDCPYEGLLDNCGECFECDICECEYWVSTHSGYREEWEEAYKGGIR